MRKNRWSGWLNRITGLVVLVAMAGCSEDSPPARNAVALDRPVLSFDQALAANQKLLSSITWTRDHVRRRAKISLSSQPDLKDSLPEIGHFDLVVAPAKSPSAITVEVFSSTEKAGKGTDGWLVEVAKAFNEAGVKVDGRHAQVALRRIASGTGYQFIASGKYTPDGFSPSNHLWIRMAEAHGVLMRPVAERLVGNTAGIVMKTEVVAKVREQYNTVTVESLIDSVVQGRLVMGYTNPFASSTGLNFLVTVLSTFANGAEKKLLDPDVVGTFESFQRGVPFVALTTLQMRDSVVEGGRLDAFVMEQQTFRKTAALANGYEFIPFGMRHDNPLYAVGDISAERRAVLDAFAKFAAGERYRQLADEYGFNQQDAYAPTFSAPGGETLVRAQKLWKEKKDAGRPIAAIFLVDVSGSMSGSRIRRVRAALQQGAEFINARNAIGLVLFSDAVREVLPVQPFDLNQKAAFLAAVEDMDSGGSTAMYDGIVVSLSLLVAEKLSNPDIKPLLFVLTDGETTAGNRLSQVERSIRGLGIPVYTVGYEARVGELARLSSLVEAASINADEGEVAYQIGNLLNAQM